jgi:lipopolysaccharide/colanic/teichoic acid biosynthesis glycosyltransferase
MRKRPAEDRPDPLSRVRHSPLPAQAIPLPLRALDLGLTLVAAPFAAVLGALLAIAVWLDSPGPVIYRSRRIGCGGRPFTMLKFRTMVRNAGGPPLSAHDDERYTPLGRSLARTRLDELPQLWNVIRGEMRLVGPRPELEAFVADFPAEYERILGVPPGLTGPAQVEYAWEGEVLARAQAIDRARVYRESILPLKLAIDIRYAERHTLGGDLVLLVKTLALPARRIGRRALMAFHAHRPTPAELVSGTAMALALVVLVGLLAAEARAPF